MTPKSAFRFLAMITLGLAGCSYGHLSDHWLSPFCEALDEGDPSQAGALLDEQAKTLTSPDWQANVDSLVSWLKAQDCIQTAESAYPVIETLPVQTEILFTRTDGSSGVVDLWVDLEGGSLWFHGFH